VKEALDPPAGPDDEASAIGFGTFLDRVVPQNGIKPLGTTVGIDELRKQGFMVQAYKTGGIFWKSWTEDKTTPNFMENQKVTWDGGDDDGTWTYSPIKYWPVSDSDWGNVTFFAYSPSTVAFSGVANGDPQLYYAVPSDLDAQPDLIVATKCNAQGNGGKVTFEFDHILSRIGFKVKLKNAYDDVTIRLTRVRLTRFSTRNAGTYTFNSSTVTGHNTAPGNWKFAGTSAGYYDLFTGDVTLTGNDVLDISGQNGAAKYLMFIPQTIGGAHMHIRTDYYLPGSNSASQTYSAATYLESTTWEPGKAYTYTINMAAPALIMDVEESWDNWGPEENKDVNIPDIPDTP
jgi:hypothetical protein